MLAGIEYMGIAGTSSCCKEAILRLLQFGDQINEAKLLSNFNAHGGTHSFLLNVNYGDWIAVKSGFSSGYKGEGPRALSVVLELFIKHGVEVEEYEVPLPIIDRLDQSALTEEDLDKIRATAPVRPAAWYDYILDADDTLFSGANPDLLLEFPHVIPYAILDPRLNDLALSFHDNPDNSLLVGFRRLEGLVRERTGLTEHGAKLFSRAFHGEQSKLYWKGRDASELEGMASMFTAIYKAFRNRRAHHEPEQYSKPLREFLMLNQLYVFEKEAIEREQ